MAEIPAYSREEAKAWATDLLAAAGERRAEVATSKQPGSLIVFVVPDDIYEVALKARTPEPNDGVPAGKVDDVLAWVGNDVERAHKALAAEALLIAPRVGVAGPLEKLIADATTPPAGPGGGA